MPKIIITFRLKGEMNIMKKILYFMVIICFNTVFSHAYDLKSVTENHPRLLINTNDLIQLRQETVPASAGKHQMWLKFKSAIPDDWTSSEVIAGQALVYLILKDSDQSTADVYANQAIQGALAVQTETSNREKLRDRSVAVSMVYDWTYSKLTASEKETIRNKLKTMANKQIDQLAEYENGPFANYYWAAVSSVGLIGMALAGEVTEAQSYIDWAADRYPEMIAVLNHFKDGGWHEGYNYDWESTGVGIRYLAAIKTATGYDPFQETEYYKNHGYWCLYGLRPDNTWCRSFDNGYPTILDFQKPWFAFMAKQYQDPHIQWFYRNKISKNPDNPYDDWSWTYRSIYSVCDLIWYDASLAEKHPENLPLARYFSGVGMVLGRSDWSDDATWFSARAQNYYTSHGHIDEGAFSIYQKGSLAIDSGIYDGYNSPHHWGYYKRTIANNVLLIYDPQEPVYDSDNLHPDGGQRIPTYGSAKTYSDWQEYYNSQDYSFKTHADTGEKKTRTSFHTADWIAFENNDTYTYFQMDITKSYDSYKVNNVLREIVYLRPNYFVVFDRVSSKNSNHEKKWLLHSINEPSLKSNDQYIQPTQGITDYNGIDHVLVEQGQGKLFTKTVLPELAKIRTVGGNGYEYYYHGTNYQTSREPNSGYHEKEEAGTWRIEISPINKQNNDYFLHLLFTADASTTEMPDSLPIIADNMQGILINNSTTPYIIMFSGDFQGLAVDSVTYNANYDESLTGLHLLTSMKPSDGYDIYKDGAKIFSNVKASEQGTLTFESKGGSSFKVLKATGSASPSAPNNLRVE